jgi:hypothetical protein
MEVQTVGRGQPELDVGGARRWHAVRAAERPGEHFRRREAAARHVADVAVACVDDRVEQLSKTVAADRACHAHRVWSADAMLDMTIPAAPA